MRRKGDRQMIRARLGLGLSLTLIMPLAGCGSEQKAADDKAQASGQILPGSASDAMLPLDTVKSQPPLAPHVKSTEKAKDKAASGSETSNDTAEPAATPAEAAEPAPTGE